MEKGNRNIGKREVSKFHLARCADDPLIRNRCTSNTKLNLYAGSYSSSFYPSYPSSSSFFLYVGVPQDAAHLLLLRIRRRLQHLHEEIIDWHVTDHLEEEQVLEALETDRTDGWQAKQ